MYQALGQAAIEFRLPLSTRVFLSARYVPVRCWDSVVSKTDVIPSFLRRAQEVQSHPSSVPSEAVGEMPGTFASPPVIPIATP